jgi:hypothetical protein
LEVSFEARKVELDDLLAVRRREGKMKKGEKGNEREGERDWNLGLHWGFWLG